MSNNFKNLWLCMDAFAAVLRCEERDAEETLDDIENELATMSSADRDNARKKMICIVAQLSRLEVRMMTQHGPMRPFN
jgi:hypothetical protein